MKSIKPAIALTIAALIIFMACQKETSDSKKDQTKMVSNKTVVKPGESVSFSVQNGTPGAIARWNVVPDTNVVIDRPISWDQTNTVQFTDTGTYTVNVEIEKVWCDSVAAAHPGMDTCLNNGTLTGKASATIVVKN